VFRRIITVFLLFCISMAVSAVYTPRTQAQIKLAPLEYRERVLANGLKIYSVQVRTSPTVSIQVWYKVGSKDDPEGRSGFAHLFEHIMFKKTKNMKAEMMDRFTEDVGGFNNAETFDDYTAYFEVIPSNYLETLLWAESDRMSGLVVDDAIFKSERDVVKEEYRERVLASPYGRLFYLFLSSRGFVKHPYKRPGIGSIEDLTAATIDDVKAFHSTFYRPDNATLLVAGDFDQKQLDEWIDKYLGRLSRPSSAMPRVTIKETPRTSEQRFVEYAPNVPLPAVIISYPAPPISSAEAPALAVAESILSAGASSRLYQALVYEQQSAQQTFATSNLLQDAGQFYVGAILASGKKPEEVEQSLAAEVKRLQQQPVGAAELEKAKNQIIASQLRQRETNYGKASALGTAAVLLGDVKRVNTVIEEIDAVTAADVQKAMQRFTDSSRVVIHYLSEAARTGSKPAGGGLAESEGRR